MPAAASLRCTLRPRHVRRPLVHPTPFAKFPSEVQRQKHKHLEAATRPPPPGWSPKPNGVAFMPAAWLKSGLGLHLCTLSQKELEDWALKALRPEVDRATKADGDYVVAEENLMDFMFKRSTLKTEIIAGAERAFGTLIPHEHRRHIASVRNLVDWVVQRVEVARPVPSYEIPPDVDLYLEMLNRIKQRKKLRGEKLQAQWDEQVADPWRDQFDWDFQQPPADAGWLGDFVKKEADRVLAERAKEEERRQAEERKAAAKEAALKALAERKAKALAMKAMLQAKAKAKEKKDTVPDEAEEPTPSPP